MLKIEAYKRYSMEYELFITRYRVIDADSNKVIDDAQGYGYKSGDNALKSYCWKNPGAESLFG